MPSGTLTLWFVFFGGMVCVFGYTCRTKQMLGNIVSMGSHKEHVGKQYETISKCHKCVTPVEQTKRNYVVGSQRIETPTNETLLYVDCLGSNTNPFRYISGGGVRSYQHHLIPGIARVSKVNLKSGFREGGRILVGDVFHWIQVAETSSLPVCLNP